MPFPARHRSVRHIYRKLSIPSQQDLIHLIDGVELEDMSARLHVISLPKLRISGSECGFTSANRS